MDRMKDFKKISDEIMKDIVVGEELKASTLARCKRNSYKSVTGILVPAACVILIVTAVNLMGWFPHNRTAVRESNSQATLMLESAQSTGNMPRDSAQNQLKAAQSELQLEFQTWEQARMAFGEKALKPGFIPEGFKLNNVVGWGTDIQNANIITINYTAENAAFQVSQEKTGTRDGFEGFRRVDVHGVSGYVRTEEAKEDTAMKNQHTELHWLKDGIHYSVTGQLNEEMALKVAGSMQ
ncbi:MAG: hypothetical protein K0R50_2226 [Eubacterium sp.]|nr:hypothetical protein [Eubacterium sp.]